MKYADMQVGTIYSFNTDTTKFMKVPPEVGHYISLKTGYLEVDDPNPEGDYVVHCVLPERLMTRTIELLQYKYKVATNPVTVSITITDCIDCNHSGLSMFHVLSCSRANRDISDKPRGNLIPDWCPLRSGSEY